MDETAKPSSPLVLLGRSDYTTPDGAVALRDRSLIGKISVRGKATDPGFIRNVAARLGVELPVTPNRTATRGARTLLWLAPDEWLLICRLSEEAGIARALDDAGVVCTPVSDGWGAVRLAGDRAMDVLKKGTGLDVNPRVFAPGHCARTRLAQCAVLLHRLAEQDGYDIYCERSYTEYLWLWLEDAALEFTQAAKIS